MPTLDARIESLISDLPDQKGARLFLEAFSHEHPRAHQNLINEAGLLSDVLALASWSPILATTLGQNPEYLSWLMRERQDVRVRTREQLKESLARFALTNSSLNPHVMLARFRRRELLRIYLHDIRSAHTLVETTEELSNLADAILDYALGLVRQELDNKYGAPLRADEHGRIANAEFCIIALGKLGSYELNYASDIDLIFVYSDEGTTAGSGERDKVTNREYFIKLSEGVTRVVGQPAGEGAAYRVDLRLRPHGRDGALACSLDEARYYYSKTAQAWELQALIRARAAAGSLSLFSRFASAVESHVFRREVSVKEALASVRLAKQKIDRSIERAGSGFNVKLNRGGIREIEFIAQALQLTHGGSDDWLRVAHTLKSLGRLADRNLISEQQRVELFAAYAFLRTLEHRLQMEHGLQTHTVPEGREQRSLIARRMNFYGSKELRDFDEALKHHTLNVRRAFDRVFAEDEADTQFEKIEGQEPKRLSEDHSPEGHTSIRERRSAFELASAFLPHLQHKPQLTSVDSEALTGLLLHAAIKSANPHRAMMLAGRVAASIEKSTEEIQLSPGNLISLMQVCGASELFGEMIANNPSLIVSANMESDQLVRRDSRAILRAAIDAEKSYSEELSALRRAWSRLLAEIGARDAAGGISVFESNRLQTDLAVASVNVAYLIARREIVRRYGTLDAGPRIAVLGLGRLGSAGVDYGSDLDIIIVYDSLVRSPVHSLTQDEAYARLGELMVGALSSVTREGYLYRVDLRLRPDGNNGPLVISSQAFLDYLRQRATIWEWLAYVKLKAVAGDLELGRMIETHARHAIHEKAQETPPEELKNETRRVRDRLEKEKARRRYRHGIDIKYAAGGMLDVYFATRYLQLQDDVRDEGEDRSTSFTLHRLHESGSLDSEDFAALSNGYALLRAIDHHVRLTVGQSGQLPATDHVVAEEIAKKLGFSSAGALNENLQERMRAVRQAYDRITAVAET